MKRLAPTAAVLILLSAPTVFAQLRSEVRTCELEPTQAGFYVDASGVARFESDLRSESFAVKVMADVPDGTVLVVSVSTKADGLEDVGAIGMLLGAGALELNSYRDRYSAAFPGSDVTSVLVRKGNVELLKGTCTSQVSLRQW